MRSEPDQILGDLQQMQHFFNAHIHLVKVYNSEWISANEVKERLEEFAALHGFKDYSVEAAKESDEVDAIIDYAEKLSADMIALATHHRRGLESIFSGFISKRIVDESQRPIWTKAIDN